MTQPQDLDLASQMSWQVVFVLQIQPRKSACPFPNADVNSVTVAFGGCKGRQAHPVSLMPKPYQQTCVTSKVRQIR